MIINDQEILTHLKVRITSGICNRKFCAKPMQQLNAFSYGTSITFLGNENIDNAACFGHYMFTRTIQARSRGNLSKV